MILSSLEQKIYDVLEPVAKSIGYEIVKVMMQGSNRKVLDIAIDKLDGASVTIRDCKTASNNFSATLDVEDIISDRYYLEVGSAGVERPLVKLADFDRFLGREITLKTHKAIDDVKKFQGTIESNKDGVIELKIKEGLISLEYSNIKSANLVFTEEMFRKVLKKEAAQEPEIESEDK